MDGWMWKSDTGCLNVDVWLDNKIHVQFFGGFWNFTVSLCKYLLCLPLQYHVAVLWVEDYNLCKMKNKIKNDSTGWQVISVPCERDLCWDPWASPDKANLTSAAPIFSGWNNPLTVSARCPLFAFNYQGHSIITVYIDWRQQTHMAIIRSASWFHLAAACCAHQRPSAKWIYQSGIGLFFKAIFHQRDRKENFKKIC